MNARPFLFKINRSPVTSVIVLYLELVILQVMYLHQAVSHAGHIFFYVNGHIHRYGFLAFYYLLRYSKYVSVLSQTVLGKRLEEMLA